jgi:hypothetical protein
MAEPLLARPVSLRIARNRKLQIADSGKTNSVLFFYFLLECQRVDDGWNEATVRATL